MDSLLICSSGFDTTLHFCSEMSQNPADSQALLQSMLQKLRLQPGRERTLAWGQDEATAGPANGTANGYDFAAPAKSSGLTSEDGSAGIGGGEGVQPGLGHGVDSVSFLSVSSSGVGAADVTSFDRTDGETGEQAGQEQQLGFTPRLYAWSLRPSDPDSPAGKALHAVGNGGFAAATQNSLAGSRRNPRASDSKTRRWTQRIKEKWRDRPGSKKGKQEAERRPEQEISASPQNLQQPSEHGGEGTLASSNSRDPTQTLSEDAAADAHVRSSSDFEFSLGSFSLLEEIVTGQEWAKFLNPVFSAPSANQRPAEEPLSPPAPVANPYDGALPPASSQGGFTGGQPQTVSMDVAAGTPELMEDVNNQSHMQLGEGGPQHHRALERADILDSSAPKIRISLNRKRQHQSSNGAGERGRLQSSPSSTAMDQTADNPLNSASLPPPPPPPSFPAPHAPAPRGVLKHSISQDSQCSMETVTKRRRVEENRRVRFSEEILTIDPVEMDQYAAASEEEDEEAQEEEDSWAEEDSVQERDGEAEPAAMEEAAPARRPALPAWILALKRRNGGRKHR